MKKFVLILIDLFVVIFSVFLINLIVYAEGINYGEEYYNELKEGEVLNILEDNSILITTYDKIATTGIRYKTLGYGLKKAKEDTIETKNGKVDEKVPLVQHKLIETLTNNEDSSIKPGYMISTQVIYSTSLYEQVGNIDTAWINELYSNGGTIYLDGIMTINQYGKMLGSMEYKDGKYITSGEIYSTVDGIKNARGWINADDLHTHYNKKVTLMPLKTNIGFIEANLDAVANPSIVQRGVNTSVQVTLDSSQSRAKYKKLGEDIKDATITNRRYWITTSDGRTIEQVDNGETVTITVDNVTSDTILECYVRVYSQELADLNSKYIVPQDEAKVVINLGQKGGSSATGNLNADKRGNEKFNVLQGIPTDETLYANIITEEYLTDFSSRNITGTRTYTVTVRRTYNLSWQEDVGQPGAPNWVNRSATEVRERTYNVVRDYSFHVIDSMAVYALDRAVINNECLPSGSVTLLPKGYTEPAVEVSHSDNLDDHIQDPVYRDIITLPSESLSGGRSGRPSVPDPDWSDIAESEVGLIQVKNDKLIIDGFTVMEDNLYPMIASLPKEPPKAAMIGKDVLYMDNIKIDAKTLNGEYQSTGTVYYKRIAGVNSTEDERTGRIDVNPVIVHTPVVCDPVIESDVQYNQEIKPDDTRTAMILGRTTKLTFPTIGKYINKKGYMNADYRKYTMDRIVKFPFDVYVEDKFLKAGTEYHLPENIDVLNIKVPTWVDEGNYNVECRAIAINSPGNDNLKQELSNISYANYIAVKSIPVRVIGRLYGFKITDISDYPDWAEVFRTSTNSTKHSGNYYWVGDLDENGQKRGNADKYTLPILNGSHSTKKNLGVLKTGYRFKFELTTIGNYFNDLDLVRIKPRFYYVNKDGSGRREVDLWYQEKIDGAATLAKVGSKVDSKNIKTIVLGDPLRNVPDQELLDTVNILKDISKNEFANQKAKIGSYGDVILSKTVRTFVGDTSSIPADVDKDRVKKSVQKWYGEYWVPNNAFVCEKGFDVAKALANKNFTGKENFWLKNGYIIVNFEIETIKNKDAANPQLSYWGSSHSNMWKIEGFDYTKKDGSGAAFTLSDGDVIFYYTDKRSSDDYSSGGTN